MTQPGRQECTVMMDLWGWEQQWHRSTGLREWTTQSPIRGELRLRLSCSMGRWMGRVWVDHLPLVSMYKSHSKALPARVDKHKSKLRAFDFDVVYEAGITTPSDYGSRHPPPTKQYTADEREDLGV